MAFSPLGPDVHSLGLVPYDAALAHQDAAWLSVSSGGVDQVLLLEHPPTITLGRRSQPEHLPLPVGELRARGIAVHEVRRGGSVTYHGPGQLVGYPIVDLGRRGLGMHDYLRLLEGTLVGALRDFGIDARVRDGLTGVWTARGKIAAIGIGVRRGVTFHGFALNISVDLSAFELIVPCGLAGEVVTSMEALGRPASLAEVEGVVAPCLLAGLARASRPAPP